MSTIKKLSIQTPLILSATIATTTLTPAQATNVTELDDAIDLIKTLDPENETCSIEKVVFARGIQSYKFVHGDGPRGLGSWGATGPLAQLYDTDYLDPQDEEILIGEEKIGTHYQHLAKPAWEFPEGRVIVESASAMPSPDGSDNVAWLNVKINNDENLGNLGYNRLYRVLTDRGVAPPTPGSENDTIGSGYTTYYVFLDCVED